MTKSERQEIIINKVRLHNRVILPDLAETLGVSIDTVRRDVKELDSKGMITKVHGGAVSKGFDTYVHLAGNTYAQKNKAIIGQKAINLIKNGNTLFIGGGTTTLEMVRMFPPKLKATVITPSLPVAMQLMQFEDVRINIIGGQLSKESRVVVGGFSINMIQGIYADYCFMGSGCLDPIRGVTELDWEVSEMKKALCRSSKQVVCLTISEKLNTSHRYAVCSLDEIDHLVTELEPSNDVFALYRQKGIQII